MNDPSQLLDTDAAIRSRKTTKVLAKADLPTVDLAGLVIELLPSASMAPFHRPCDESHRQAGKQLVGIEPWRFYLLRSADCRRLRTLIPLEQAGKIPAMLSAADALVMATWLPNPPSSQLPDGQLFEASLANMEHIAAASTAIQNLLLAATARGVSSYWSSGGVLRSKQVFDLLEIPVDEILLGAVFLFPRDTGDADVVGSKLRDKRSQFDKWSRWIAVKSPNTNATWNPDGGDEINE